MHQTPPHQYTGPILRSTAQPTTALAISNTIYVVLGPTKNATIASAAIPHLGETRSFPSPPLYAGLQYEKQIVRNDYAQECHYTCSRRTTSKDFDQYEEGGNVHEVVIPVERRCQAGSCKRTNPHRKDWCYKR